MELRTRAEVGDYRRHGWDGLFVDKKPHTRARDCRVPKHCRCMDISPLTIPLARARVLHKGEWSHHYPQRFAKTSHTTRVRSDCFTIPENSRLQLAEVSSWRLSNGGHRRKKMERKPRVGKHLTFHTHVQSVRKRSGDGRAPKSPSNFRSQ